MSDRPKSTPSHPSLAGWTESYGFRETFLSNFTQPGHATALTIVSMLLHEYALEFARHWPDPGEPPTRREVRAAAADLKWLSGYLKAVGRERVESSLAPTEVKVAETAERVADEVARQAEVLEGAVGKHPSLKKDGEE